MKILYKAQANSIGGRKGKVTVKDSPLEFQMTAPVELGGTGEKGTNPEQLFAAGYAACFESAVLHVARNRKLDLKETSVQVEVGIGPNGQGGYLLAVWITATLNGVDQQIADEVVREAHKVCPYSNATRGNIEVTVTAKTL